MNDYEIHFSFQKMKDPDRRLVAGFGYVTKSADGELITDTQGDMIDTEVLRDAVHDFAKDRTLGVMHVPGADGKPAAGGEIVEMAVLGGDYSPPGWDGPEGLWMVAKVHDDAVWQMVKAGVLKGFSIGGKAMRVPT